MAQNQINTKRIISNYTCLTRNTIIGSPEKCGDLVVKTKAQLEGDFYGFRINPYPENNGDLQIGYLIFTSDGLDMNCFDILNGTTIGAEDMTAKFSNINFNASLLMREPRPNDGKLTWDSSIQLGDTNNISTDPSGISLGPVAKTGVDSIAVGSNTGNTTGNNNISVGKCSGLNATGNKNINVGTNSTSMNNINGAITFGNNAIAQHEGAIVLGSGVSNNYNKLHLNFPSGGNPINTLPTYPTHSYLTICVNGRRFHIVGRTDDTCFDAIISAFSEDYSSNNVIRGNNYTDGNLQYLANYLDKYTGENLSTGGFLITYSVPGDSVMGIANYVSGLRIVNFSEAVPSTMSMFNLPYSLYIPLNINPNPTIECPVGWPLINTPIKTWTNASNINLVNNGSTASISWDPILGAQEYGVSVTISGTMTSTNTYYLGSNILLPTQNRQDLNYSGLANKLPPAGYVITGYDSWSGAIIDWVRFKCRELLPDGTLGPVSVFTTASNSNPYSIGNSGYTDVDFPGDSVLVGMTVNDGDYQYGGIIIYKITFIYKSLAQIIAGEPNTINTGTSIKTSAEMYLNAPYTETTQIAPTSHVMTGAMTSTGGYLAALAMYYAEVINNLGFSLSATHHYGKIIDGSNFSTTVDISQVGTSIGYWSTIDSIVPRVVGYELCNKNMSNALRCITTVPTLGSNGCINGTFTNEPYQLCFDIDSLVTGIPGAPGTVTITKIEIPQAPRVDANLINFTGWTSYQYSPINMPPMGNGLWVISPGGYTATQTGGAEPPIHLAKLNALKLLDYVVQIIATPITSGSDWVGFTIGYNPGDEININADYLIVTWKGDLGTRLYRQQGLVTHSGGTPTSWTLISSGATRGNTGWSLGVSHTWKFEYTGTQLKIFIDNISEFDLPWTFVNNTNVGLLGYSQTVRYDNGYIWTNVCCPATQTTVSNWVASPGCITTTTSLVNNTVCVSPQGIERAIRLGVTVNGTGGASNEGLIYFGFKCSEYLNYLETITITQTFGNPGANQAATTRYSSFVSNVNKRYLFVVKGITDFALGGGSKRDARYFTSTFPTGWTLLTGTDAYRIDNVNITTPAVYNDDHQYYDVRSGTGTVFQITYLDSDYNDNDGTITSDIYEICSTGPLQDGLFGRRYNNYFNDNPNWFTTAIRQGQTSVFTTINFSSNADFYSWEWNGFFRASATGSWTFYTTSDDASFLWIGDVAVSGFTTGNALVNNAGLHGMQERSGSINLVAGLCYPIRIQFGELGGGDQIIVEFAGPSIGRTTNGFGFFFHPTIL